MITVNFLPLLNEYCAYAKKAKDAEKNHQPPPEATSEWYRNIAGICGVLHLQPSLPIGITLHINCCLDEILMTSWLPIEQRRIVACTSAKSLVQEATRLASAEKAGIQLSKQEKEKLVQIDRALTWLASWANAELPREKTMGKLIIPVQPAEWEKFYNKLSTRQVEEPSS